MDGVGVVWLVESGLVGGKGFGWWRGVWWLGEEG